MGKYCSNSGRPTEETARVCGHCGAPLNIGDPVNFYSGYEARLEQDKSLQAPLSGQAQSSSKCFIGGIVSAVLGVISVVASVIYGCCFTYSGTALSYYDDEFVDPVHPIDSLMESLLFVGIGILGLAVLLLVLHWKNKKIKNE